MESVTLRVCLDGLEILCTLEPFEEYRNNSRAASPLSDVD